MTKRSLTLPRTVRLSALHSACVVLCFHMRKVCVFLCKAVCVSEIIRGRTSPDTVALQRSLQDDSHNYKSITGELFSRNKLVNRRKQIYELYF